MTAAPGTGWPKGSFDAALRAAEGGRLALKLEAAWCSMCTHLDHDVLDTPTGEALFGSMTRLAIDFDAPEARELVRRYAILDLPTVVVVGREGRELGRVVGYSDSAEWVARARVAVSSDDPLAEARARVAERPTDPFARLALAEAQLSIDAGAAVPVLETLACTDDPKLAPRALFVLGRYFDRALGDPKTALHIWRELATRYPAGDYAHGAALWYANAHAQLGAAEVGAEGLGQLAQRTPLRAATIIEWARFVGRHGIESHRQVVMEVAMRALNKARGHERDDLEELVLQLGRGLEPGAGRKI
ncbi:MAG: hypothetical protein AB7S26_19760 [Sandaracinaceae bacterium]